MALQPHLALEGSRIVYLADALQITKQAVSQRVTELVGHGVVEVPELSDLLDRAPDISS